jgi:hypothetical protein
MAMMVIIRRWERLSGTIRGGGSILSTPRLEIQGGSLIMEGTSRVGYGL